MKALIFYEQLEKLCKLNNIKPSNLVESLGMSKGTMSNWKKGGVPNAEAVVRFAEHFGVTTDYLLLGKENCHSTLSAQDEEWLSLIHALPAETQRDLLGALRMWPLLHGSSVAADESLKKVSGK